MSGSLLGCSMLTSSGWVGLWPVTMTRPAFSSALASVASRIAGGHCVELAMVWCCIAIVLVALSVMRLTSSATSKSDVGTQSESVRAKLTVGKTKHSASKITVPAHV